MLCTAMWIDCSIDFLPDAKHLSVVNKTALADILGSVVLVN